MFYSKIWWDGKDLKYIRNYLGIIKKKIPYTSNNKLFFIKNENRADKRVALKTVDYRRYTKNKHLTAFYPPNSLYHILLTLLPKLKK